VQPAADVCPDVNSNVYFLRDQSLQISGIDIKDWLAGQFGVRYGLGLENYFTNWRRLQPTGLLNSIQASGASAVVATRPS
jgi:hypothetical protein